MPALIVSGAGLGLATLLALFSPQSAYVYMLGVSLFGGLFVWFMIFVTHIAFRPKWDASGRGRLPIRMPFYPYSSILGAALIAAILVTTWWVEGMRVTLIAGLPWLAVVSAAYWFIRRK